MTDLVQRLRMLWHEDASGRVAIDEAADEIERLRLQCEHLRRALSGRPSSELFDAALAEKDAEIERQSAALDRLLHDVAIAACQREADEALLRQALEALSNVTNYDLLERVRFALRERLGKKP